MTIAVETLHPDVFVVEERGVPRIPGIGVNTGGFVGVAEKGPIDQSTLVTSLDQFEAIFGGVVQGSFLHLEVGAFFQQGGSRCYVNRIVGVGAAVADETIQNEENQASIDVDAASPGAWGNQVTLKSERYRTVSAAAAGPNPPPVPTPVPAVAVGSTWLGLGSVRGIRLGDLLVVTDAGTGAQVQGFVAAVYASVRVVQVTPLALRVGSAPAPLAFPAGSLVQSVSSHRATTISSGTLAIGQLSLQVASSFNMVIGSRLLVVDPATAFSTSVLVTGIDGNLIRFAAAAPPATLAAGSVVVSQEFDLRVYEKGQLAEQHELLSMEPTNQRDYFGIRLSGESNESNVIQMTDLMAAPGNLLNQIPEPFESLVLAGGTEGATPTDNDFIGSEVAPKSGIYLFDEISEVNFFSIPGVTTVAVHGAAIDYAENRGTLMFIGDVPLADDEAQEAYDYRLFELNKDASQAALYYPWLIVRDPQQGNQRMAVPPSGFIQGVYAQVGAIRGVHVAPANVALRGVLDLTHQCTDGEQDILNPIGVNVIRAFPGEGIRVWGCRTLFSLQDGRHYVPVRRLLNFVKESVRQGNRWAVFEPIDPRLYTLIRRVNEEFLRALWLRGQLFPSNDITRAFFVKCDEENNPMEEIRAGRVNCEIGVNPPFPAEFVIFRIGIWDGGTTIAEEIARRG